MTALAYQSPLTAFVVLVLLLSSAGLGLALRLPVSHLDQDSRDVVKSVLGLLSTMSAVLLSLLIASAKSGYDTQQAEMQEMAAKLVLLDRALWRYGPETHAARQLLREGVETGIRRIWNHDEQNPRAAALPRPQHHLAESFVDALQELTPRTELQKAIQAQALQISSVLAQLRILMSSQGRSALSLPLLVILVSWVMCLFFGYGLFARRNATVLIALLVGGLAVSGAIFLMVELNRPYTGLLQIPESIMRDTLTMMGRP